MLFVFLFLEVCVVANAASPRHLEARESGVSGRTTVRRLAAAHLKESIKPRSTESALRHDHELHYLEGKPIDRLACFMIYS